MANTKLLSGVVHTVPADVRKALSVSKAETAWNTITPLARNEWLCWIESAKKPETRNHRVMRTRDELLEGKRRPCCWAGCVHRADKPVSRSQKYVLDKLSKKKS